MASKSAFLAAVQGRAASVAVGASTVRGMEPPELPQQPANSSLRLTFVILPYQPNAAFGARSTEKQTPLSDLSRAVRATGVWRENSEYLLARRSI